MKTFVVTIERVQRWDTLIEAETQEEAETLADDFDLSQEADYDSTTIDSEEAPEYEDESADQLSEEHHG